MRSVTSSHLGAMSQVCDRHEIAISGGEYLIVIIADEECGCGIHRGKAVRHVSDADVWVSGAEPNYRSTTACTIL